MSYRENIIQNLLKLLTLNYDQLPKKKKVLENDVLLKVTQAYSEKGNPSALSGVEPKTFRVLVRMFYHLATGDHGS